MLENPNYRKFDNETLTDLTFRVSSRRSNLNFNLDITSLRLPKAKNNWVGDEDLAKLIPPYTLIAKNKGFANSEAGDFILLFGLLHLYIIWVILYINDLLDNPLTRNFLIYLEQFNRKNRYTFYRYWPKL